MAGREWSQFVALDLFVVCTLARSLWDRSVLVVGKFDLEMLRV